MQTLGQVLGAGTPVITGMFGRNRLYGTNGAFGATGAISNPFRQCAGRERHARLRLR
jgi:hypothetical protein